MIQFFTRIFWIGLVGLLGACTKENPAEGPTNSKPSQVTSPMPTPGSLAGSIVPKLSWSSGVFNETSVTYTLFLDSVNPPKKVLAAGLQSSSFQTQVALYFGKDYYWSVQASNGEFGTNGPVWSFTTPKVSFDPNDDVTRYILSPLAGSVYHVGDTLSIRVYAENGAKDALVSISFDGGENFFELIEDDVFSQPASLTYNEDFTHRNGSSLTRCRRMAKAFPPFL